MIFKTFNNDIDKISAIANKRKIKIDDLITYNGMSLSEPKKEAGSIWKNWFPSKKDLAIDVDSLIPELNEDIANKMLQQITTINQAKGSWSSYFSELKEQGQSCIVDLIKNTDDLAKLTGEDLVKANQTAREAAIAHNNALKQQTLSTKIGTIALQAFTLALLLKVRI